MDDEFCVGCRVRSPIGDGTVTQVNRFSVVLSLDSAPQLRLEYSKETLTVILSASAEVAEPPELPSTESPPEREPEEPETDIAVTAGADPAREPVCPDSLKTIEALRFGLVPTAGLPELTLGFEKARNWILSRLPAPNGNRVVSQVNGPFGTGKSHMMALIRCLAMKEGYAVAQVEVDGSQVSLSQPADLLAKLWQSVKAEGLPATNPLLSLYLKAAQNGLRGGQISNDGLHRTKGNLDMVRFFHENSELDPFEEALDAFISGSPQYTATQLMGEIRSQSRYPMPCQLYAVIGRDLESRPKDFIDSLVSNTLIAVHAGYKGLVVTVDEFEVEYNLSLQYLDRTKMLVDALCQYMKGRQWPKAPLGMFFAAVGQEGHQGDEIIEKLMPLLDGECYWDLKPWPKHDRKQLAEKIFALYAQTYQIDGAFQEQWFNEMERECRGDEQNIRSFIKRFVARLDEEFGPPEW